MKKVFFTIILLIAFVYVVPTFALEVSVCDADCDYTSVDKVLGAMDSGTITEDVTITVDTWNEQKLGNHTLTHSVGLSFTKNAAVVNGEGSTITVPKGADIWFEGSSIEIKNLKINYTGGFGKYENGFLEDVLYFDASNVTMNTVTLTATGTHKCNDYPNGVFNDAQNLEMTNVKIENFADAIYHGMGNLSISSSTINNNYLSIYSEGNVSIENSSVKNVISSKTVATKNVGDLKAYFYRPADLSYMTEDEVCAIYNKKGIHQSENSNMSVSMERTMEINMKKTSSIEDLLGLFIDDTTNVDDFVFTSSDEKVAKVKDNIITVLKAGEVTVIAANEDTRESYVLNLRITNPISNNPLTSPNTFFTIGIILIMLGGITIFRNIRSEQ